MSYLPSEPQDKDGNPILIDGLSNLFPGRSKLREEMARNVEKRVLTYPVGGKLNYHQLVVYVDPFVVNLLMTPFET
jgi:hypothetical protein